MTGIAKVVTAGSMVERVAKALCAREYGEEDATYFDEPLWYRFTDTARAAIEAMRPEIELARDHIVGTTGARPGSDSEDVVNQLNAILNETQAPLASLNEKECG